MFSIVDGSLGQAPGLVQDVDGSLYAQMTGGEILNPEMGTTDFTDNTDKET